MQFTILAKLLTKQDGMYKHYVFQNLDFPEPSLNRYITVTICPNWDFDENIKIGEVGFLLYEVAEAGQEYYRRNTQSTEQYNFTTNYFINFIKQKEEINQEYKF